MSYAVAGRAGRRDAGAVLVSSQSLFDILAARNSSRDTPRPSPRSAVLHPLARALTIAGLWIRRVSTSVDYFPYREDLKTWCSLHQTDKPVPVPKTTDVKTEKSLAS